MLFSTFNVELRDLVVFNDRYFFLASVEADYELFCHYQPFLSDETQSSACKPLGEAGALRKLMWVICGMAP